MTRLVKSTLVLDQSKGVLGGPGEGVCGPLLQTGVYVLVFMRIRQLPTDTVGQISR